MTDYVDEICLLLVCCLAGLVYPGDPMMIVGFLAAIVVVCASLVKYASVRITLQIIFAGVACFSFSLLCFMPLAAYAMMHERSWGARLLWVVPLCVNGALGLAWQPLIWASVLCAIASIMAIKDVRAASEHASLQQAYDLLREQTFSNTEAARETEQSAHEHEESYGSAFFEGLTKRELAVVHLVAEGMDNREISQELFLSEGTVRNHISSILAKKNLQNRTQIAVMYFRG